MIRRYIIALLGRADAPTDAVEEYCRYLGEALRAHEFGLSIERVPWAERGWRRGLRSLRRRARGWHGKWVLVQYTALAWSVRGFPLRFPRALKILKDAGVRLGVVFHDTLPFEGTRMIDRLRRRTQLRVMREALRLADVAVFTVPLEKLSWITSLHANAVFIPVGANFPPPGEAHSRAGISKDGKLNVAVFGVTGGRAAQKEIGEIAEAIRFASSQVQNLRLTVFGRNSKEAEAELRKCLDGAPIEIQVLGVLSNEEVARTLSGCDALLFVRGPVSSRRGSAIAAIACGLPVIASEGPETAPPITEAGLAFYSPQRKGDLGDLLVRVLQDEHYRASLAQRSWIAQQRHFSWTAIAARYLQFLGKAG